MISRPRMMWLFVESGASGRCCDFGYIVLDDECRGPFFFLKWSLFIIYSMIATVNLLVTLC